MYGKDHGGGWAWTNGALEKLLRKEEILARAAADIVRKNPGELAPFWLAKFLWDVLYGNGCPFVRVVDPGPLTPSNFDHCNFDMLIEFVLDLDRERV